jgi:hypothetical protein
LARARALAESAKEKEEKKKQGLELSPDEKFLNMGAKRSSAYKWFMIS